ncbi:MAG: hypothetical protein E4H36_11145 [Spirochaetales bacterium]|nr:MAG: hypothetical protein E4H36_11145 [Spirochaetales bacterium]
MLAFKELQDILQITIKWEEKIKELYEVAEYGLKDMEAKNVIVFLKENHTSRLDILKNLKVKDYGATEWVRFSADYKTNDLITAKIIRKDSTALEICNVILEYENKIRDFYEKIANNLKTASQKELFESLTSFKDEQISRIKNFKDQKLCK